MQSHLSCAVASLPLCATRHRHQQSLARILFRHSSETKSTQLASRTVGCSATLLKSVSLEVHSSRFHLRPLVNRACHNNFSPALPLIVPLGFQGSTTQMLRNSGLLDMSPARRFTTRRAFHPRSVSAAKTRQFVHICSAPASSGHGVGAKKQDKDVDKSRRRSDAEFGGSKE